ncbi:hypothetical protein Bca52824_058359 [Brassica carinata]|uniref:Uncharacterized protein n=2 Tax=Brassica TaxID=3705 RepID=A0A8X7UEM6_BRACI|nr:hypothetical protein Bca52824_058359 [Brassica carinata]
MDRPFGLMEPRPISYLLNHLWVLHILLLVFVSHIDWRERGEALGIIVYDEYQKAIAQKQRLSYTPLPRLARAALSSNGLSSTSLTSAEVMPNRDPSVDAHRRLIGDVFLLRSQVQDIMARRDLLGQQVKASARWELMKEWLENRVEHWNPEEECRHHLFLSGGINHKSGSFSQAATPRSVVGSRFPEEPSF